MARDRGVVAGKLVRRACETHADRLLATHGDETVTYREAWERGGRLAAALSTRGLDPGDHVGLMMGNQLDYFTGAFACIRGGYVLVPMNDMLRADEFQYMLEDSGARGILVGSEFTETLASIEPALSTLDVRIAVDDPVEGQEHLDEVLTATEGTRDVPVAGDDRLMLPYTGGTTGKPKGVKHTHASLGMDMLAHVTELEIRDGEEMLMTTPLPHAAGYIALGGLVQGAHFTLTTGFDPGQFLALVDGGRISWTFLVPTQLYRLLDHDALETTDVSGLNTIVYGAAPITPERLEDGMSAFGPIFIQLYGQTEMPDIGTILPKDDHVVGEQRVESCGKPAAMVDVRIANPDDHEDTAPIPPGEEGELLMRSPYAMEEYHERPASTEETLVDGWLRTGDIARQDEDGYVYLLDRATDMIITGGMNVYTTEVEDAIDRHPGVAQVAVIGTPHEEWGESVHAVVVPEADADPTAEAIREFAGDRLADYKKPKSVEFVEEIPTTPYGKVDKKALREPYWEESDREIN
ncbi:MAG: AMP-binding protein [Haloferacaceae archaeon]